MKVEEREGQARKLVKRKQLKQEKKDLTAKHSKWLWITDLDLFILVIILGEKQSREGT